MASSVCLLRSTCHGSCNCDRMGPSRSSPTRKALQALFARAAARRAERRVFVQTLRRILNRRVTLEPMLLLRLDRRRAPREA